MNVNATLQTILVEAKSKTGVLDATTNKWLNPTLDAKGLLAELVIGHSYNVELQENTGKNGVKYMNIAKIVGSRGPSADVPKIVAPVFNNTPEVKPAYKKSFNKFTKKSDAPATDWAAKDRSQLIGGLSHDAAELAAQAVELGVSSETMLAKYKEILVGLIQIRTEVK